MLLQAVAPIRQYRAECAAAGAIADKAFLVAQLFIVRIDSDGGQYAAPMGQRCRGCVVRSSGRFFCHVIFSVVEGRKIRTFKVAPSLYHAHPPTLGGLYP